MSSSSITRTPVASPATSSAIPPATSHDPRFTIVGAILGTVGLLLIVGIVFITLRVRKRQIINGEKVVRSFQGTAVLDKNHPAARIIPFGTPRPEVHSFQHAPGQNMRIAIRRPDGAWDFTDPSEPFSPAGVSDICPSPASSTTQLISKSTRKSGPSTKSTPRSPSAVLDYKEQESRAAKLIRLGYDARDNLDDDLGMSNMPLPHPPPAYGHEPTVGPYVTFRPSGSRVQSSQGTSSRNMDYP